MAVEDEKLRRFKETIFAEVEEESAQILGELDTYRAEQLEKAVALEEEKGAHLIKSRMEESKAEFSRRLTKERLGSRQRLLRCRAELVEELFDEAAQRLLAFAEGSDYESWLQQALARCGGALEGGMLLIREKDRAIFEKLAPGLPLQADLQNRLGGFVLQNIGQSLYLDETFAAKLAAEKERFYQDGALGLEPTQLEPSQTEPAQLEPMSQTR